MSAYSTHNGEYGYVKSMHYYYHYHLSVGGVRVGVVGVLLLFCFVFSFCSCSPSDNKSNIMWCRPVLFKDHTATGVSCT